MSKKGKSETTFAGARVERLLRNAGAVRVSSGAIKALDSALNAKGTAIAKRAVSIANNAGRKTVSADDIDIATRG
ncbi:MAG: histone family protein [Candidatus Hodarchaeota archaeon]